MSWGLIVLNVPGAAAIAPATPRAYNLEGDNDYVSASAGLITGTGDFTACGFVNFDSLGSINPLFGQGNPYAASGNGFTCYAVSNGVVNFRLNDGSASQLVAYGPGPLSTGTWYHVGVTIDRDGNALVYRNGVPGSAVDFSSRAGDLASATFGLGKYGAAGYYANGKFFGWKAFSGVLSTPQMLALAESGLAGSTGTIFDWTCQDTDETTTPDASGNSAVGTKQNIAAETFFYSDPAIPTQGI